MFEINSNTGHVEMTHRTVKSLRLLGNKLYGNTSITNIEIYNNNLSCSAAGKIIVELFSNHFLSAEKVNLTCNKFNSKVVGKIIILMSKCEHLKELDLSGNAFNRKDEMRLRKASRKYPNLSLNLGPGLLIRS
jgi:hypothetical protein